MSGKKPSLGRGLAERSPYLAQRAKAGAVHTGAVHTADMHTGDAPAASQLPGDRLANLPLDLLQRGKYQPRVDMRPES